MKFFDRVLLYLLVGATMSISLSMERGEPIGSKAAPALVTANALFWPVILVVGFMTKENLVDARKKVAEPTP